MRSTFTLVMFLLRCLVHDAAAVSLPPEASRKLKGATVGFEKSDHLEALQALMTPLAPYFLADFYVGQGVGSEAFQHPHRESIERAAKARKLDNSSIASLGPFDCVYVTVDALQSFTESMLPSLGVRIILMTGQYRLPMIHRTPLATSLLKSKYIAFWVSQNPIVENRRYGAIPYCVRQENAPAFLAAFRKNEETEHHWQSRNGETGISLLPRNETVMISFINHGTHRSRLRLPS